VTPAGGFHLDVPDGHRIWVETWGNPDGRPIVFLHGGPGSGCQPGQRILFDAARDWVIFIDQRGAGRSEPPRARHANTTTDLVGDLERVRRHLGIDRWMVVGGSWGATLALAYAQTYPARVIGMVLRAVFLGTRAELDWAFGDGLSRFYPELHNAFLARLAEAERANPLPAYWRRILDPDADVHRPAALAWHDVERILSELSPTSPDLPPYDPARPLPATPFMEAHYFSQNCFLPDAALLKGTSRLRGIPGRVVQARYDLLCPPQGAARLVARWPDARLIMVETAGHSLGHKAVAEAVRLAVRDLSG
jgi:proline iminopeptidase